METDKQTSDLEQTQPPAPYVKPAVERIPLSEAKAGLNPTQLVDLQQVFSS